MVHRWSTWTTLWITDIGNLNVPEWSVTPFDMEIDNKGYVSDLENELIEMHVDLKAKTLFKSKGLSEYWSTMCY